ncbi:hypothetical protein Vadar_019600 [Vaccinium darrowii]|uniref:Uncharacterized protein n=1 Tax=Vaccinium darrowii TaxID=229202 RepID=A0ACB7ZLN4_9ERIC|nr:hypothetical protein Vadar_019600 [Vaccinium darrowii]
MHHGGYWGGTSGYDYIGGSVNFFDKCHSDELSIFELWHMVRELGYEFEAIDFCIEGGGGAGSKIKSDADVLGLSKLVNGDRVVKVYSIIEIDNYFATQFFSQCDNIPTPNVTSISPGSKRTTNNTPKTKKATTISPRSKKTITSTPVSKKTTNKRSVGPVVITSSSPVSGTTTMPPSKGKAQSATIVDNPVPTRYSKQRILKNKSKYDEKLFEENIDTDEDDAGLCGPTNTANYESIVEELRDVDGYCGSSSDDLDSLCTSSDEDGVKPKKKHKVFNDQTDMENPVFMVGMEFKSHSQFRDAVKEIKTHTPQHKCIRSYDVSWVSSSWIVNKYWNRIRNNPTWPVASLHTTIQQEWTCKVDIQKVYRAKRKALNIIHGSATEQFAQLWGYVEEIRQCNPSTTIKIQMKPVPGP